MDDLKAKGVPFRIAILPDHATPVSLKTHVSDPVPYLIYDSEVETEGVSKLDEKHAAATPNRLESGVALMKKLLEEK